MNRRVFLLIILSYGLLLAGLVTLRGELLALAAPFVLYLLVGVWRAPQEIQLELDRKLGSERSGPSAPVLVTVTIRNLGSRLAEAVIEDDLPSGLLLLDGSNRHMLTLPAGQSFSWNYTVSGPRGYYAFTSVNVEAGDDWGLFRRKKNFPLAGQLLVQPPVMRIRRVAIRPRHTNIYSGTIPARTGGPGVEFFGVREYEQGDPLRWINWNASARHPQAVYSNEYEQERVADVGLVLDGRLRTNLQREDGSIFEYSVQAAAALADSFLAQGNRVGLLLYGSYLQWTFPGYGKIQRERILQALAHAETGESLVFATLGHIPTQLFPAQSQIVLVSPLAESDYEVLLQLRARSYQVLVVSPNPVAFELAGLPKRPEYALAGRIVQLERQLLLRRLRRAGVQVWDWDVAQPFDRAGSGALERPVAWLRAIGR